MAAIGINLPDEHKAKADAIAQELTRRYRVPVSRSAAIQHAIEYFFLSLCLNSKTNVLETTNAPASESAV